MTTSTVIAALDAPPTAQRARLFNPGWFLVTPSVALLLLWMIVPLGMTLYFSLIRYNLLYPGENQFIGLENFTYFLTDSGFFGFFPGNMPTPEDFDAPIRAAVKGA